LGASVALYAGGIGAIFCNQSFPEILRIVQDFVPHSLLLVTKTALAGAIIYHTLNGVRHLVWDAGYGFQLKHLYMSGYFVVAMSVIGTAIVFIKG
jgi:succinate dehydrogenase (ubiquinone) cytochrome b560 subunit